MERMHIKSNEVIESECCRRRPTILSCAGVAKIEFPSWVTTQNWQEVRRRTTPEIKRRRQKITHVPLPNPWHCVRRRLLRTQPPAPARDYPIYQLAPLFAYVYRIDFCENFFHCYMDSRHFGQDTDTEDNIKRKIDIK
jgi:hypothetical protein